MTATACGGNTESASGPGGSTSSAAPSAATTAAFAATGGPDAVALVRSAYASALDMTSVHFVMRTTGSLDRQQVMNAEGDLGIKPVSAAQGTATVKAGKPTRSEFALVDGVMYADIGTGGHTAHAEGPSFYDVAALFDPADGIPDILARLRDARTTGEETVDGTATVRVTGTADDTDITELAGIRTAHGAAGAPAPVTLWIATEAPHRLVRIHGTPKADTGVEVTFSRWGEPVSVAKPATRAVAPGAPSTTPAGVTDKTTN